MLEGIVAYSYANVL